MNVNELIDILETMPQDATVKFKRDVVGDEHDVDKAEYDEKE